MNVDEKKVTDEVTREVSKEVVREIRALKVELLKEVGDAVVAELLRIKFDDIVARATVTKLQGGK
jgi:hypothetical protein